MHLYNVQALCSRNESEDFMEEKSDSKDCCSHAQALDSSGCEAKQLREQVEFDRHVVELKRAKEAAKKMKEQVGKDQLAKIEPISDLDAINEITKVALADQLACLHQWDTDKVIPCKSCLMNISK